MWKEFAKKVGDSMLSLETVGFIYSAFDGGLEAKERIRLENSCLMLATNLDIETRVVLDRKTFDKIFGERK